MPAAHALFVEEAGVLDFMVSTTGHGGPVRYVLHYSDIIGDDDNTNNDNNHDMLITSDATSTTTSSSLLSSSSSCYIAGRHISTGEVLWRRYVCSTIKTNAKKRKQKRRSMMMLLRNGDDDDDDDADASEEAPRQDNNEEEEEEEEESQQQQQRNSHLVTTATRRTNSKSMMIVVVTMDVPNGIVRGWDPKSGSLFWDISLSMKQQSKIMMMLSSSSSQNDSSSSSSSSSSNTIVSLLVSEKGDQVSVVVTVNDDDDGTVIGVVDVTTGRLLDDDAAASVKIGEENKNNNNNNNNNQEMIMCDKSNLALSIPLGDDNHGAGSPLWLSSSSTNIQDNNNNNKKDSGRKLILHDDDDTMPRMSHSNMNHRDRYVSLTMLSCSSHSFTAFVSTDFGISQVIEVVRVMGLSNHDNLAARAHIVWTSNEGLAHPKSAFMLDASHGTGGIMMAAAATQHHHHHQDDNDEEEESQEDLIVPVVDVKDALRFTSRLKAQWEGIKSMFTTSPIDAVAISRNRRDRIFGFIKIAVISASHHSHCIYGMSTTTAAVGEKSRSSRGKVLYRVDLPRNAIWHRTIHGGPTGGGAGAGAGVAGSTSASDGGDATATTAEPTTTTDVLVVSGIPSTLAVDDDESSNDDIAVGSVHWLCFDGITGIVHGEGVTPLSSSSSSSIVTQIVPMIVPPSADMTTRCRQAAILMHRRSIEQDDVDNLEMEDDDDDDDDDLTSPPSLTVVPNDVETQRIISNQILSSSRYGFFAHVIQRGSIGTSGNDESGIASFRIVNDDDDDDDIGMLSSHLVGSTVFDESERVVHVAYPSRHQSVQSPCHIMGDDSLLLKYLNPHLVVIITTTTTTTTTTAASTTKGGDKQNIDAIMDEERFATALKAGNKKGVSTGSNAPGQKRKPAGATATSTTGDSEKDRKTSTAAAEESSRVDEQQPNMFVNVIDSVSGRILYRASHVNAAIDPLTTTFPPPSVLVSENWILYTYVNAKTRRGEIGVLSLYEGMIDSKGLSAFSGPEQSKTFSSLDARESKPVVLAKTFILAKPAVAMGITTTRGGISTRKIILATADGRIISIDRKLLEPRRPVGQVKDTEKKEGLQQYSELIPFVSFATMSYNRSIEGVQFITTARTDLESQSLVLVSGGPDIFFTRTSPAKGFDVLPDSFNRVLLSIVVTGLLIVLAIVRIMASNKIQKQGWI